jgi:hypothetical protein
MTASASSRNSTSRLPAFRWGIAAIVLICLESLVLLQAYFAFRDHFLTIEQMQEAGFKEGLPFKWHLAMWSDFFVISPLTAYITGRLRWNWREIGICFAIAFGTTVVLGLLYTTSVVPEAHVRNHQTTAVGYFHLVYMLGTIWLLLQFLIYREVSKTCLRYVSIILFLHVAVGNHFLLGLLKRSYPSDFDWYPAQPIESLPGWLTVGAVGFGLLARYYGFKKLAWALGFKPKIENDEDYLKTLDRLCQFVNIGLWTTIGIAWYRGDGFLSLVSVVLFVILYRQSRLSVRDELEIGKTLYAPDRMPREIKTIDRLWFGLQTGLFVGSYVALSLVTRCILVTSLLMFIIACFDVHTRWQINKKTRENFDNPAYMPATNDPSFPKIMERRKTAEWYLFDKPHLKKESLRALGCAVAFALANFAYFLEVKDMDWRTYVANAVDCVMRGRSHEMPLLSIAAYLVLLANLLANEYVITRWRHERDVRFGRA